MSNNTRLAQLHALEQIRGRVKDYQKINKPVKLHLGCGTMYKEGWINIDNNSDHNIEKLDLNWDLRYDLPFDDNSADFIFNEHFLEHLTAEEGQRSLKDFLRVLKPNGVMRVAMPDLATMVTTYLDPNWKERLGPYLKKYRLDFIETRAELLNINFRAWGHKWLYDWEELERRLKQAGGKNIVQAKIYISSHPELCDLETRGASTLVAEVCK